MADDFDVEALLEAPYNNREHNGDNVVEDRKSKVNDYSELDIEKNRNSEVAENGNSNDKTERKTRDASADRRPRNKSTERKSRNSRSKSTDTTDHRETKSRRSRSRHRSSSKSSRRRSRSKRRSHSRSRHSSKTKHRSRSPGSKRSRGGDHDHRRRSRSPRRRSKSRDHYSQRTRRSSRSRSHERRRGSRRSRTPISFSRRDGPPRHRRSPGGRPPTIPDETSAEERDARTIFCMQLSKSIKSRDLENFFSSVGTVREVKMITCNKTRRFKGIAYIEFKEPESVTLALALNGQKLLGIPISVQPTQAEKNRMGNTLPNLVQRAHPGPVRLYVGSLHYNVTDEMLRGIFEPFGKIDSITLMTDSESGRSKGYGFVTYHNSDDAKKALEQLNGFELAGRPMKVNNVTDRNEFITAAPSMDETDERAGIDLGATGRLQLMYKLAEGTGMQLPPAATNALNLAQQQQPAAVSATTPPIATQCFLLANMFDITAQTTAPNWDIEIQDDVIEECNRHGGCVHVYVDKTSVEGYVYVKCPTITTAVAAVNSLHGRYFAGRVIQAAYVPISNYHDLFPDTIYLTTLLEPTRQAAI